MRFGGQLAGSTGRHPAVRLAILGVFTVGVGLVAVLAGVSVWRTAERDVALALRGATAPGVVVAERLPARGTRVAALGVRYTDAAGAAHTVWLDRFDRSTGRDDPTVVRYDPRHPVRNVRDAAVGPDYGNALLRSAFGLGCLLLVVGGVRGTRRAVGDLRRRGDPAA